MAFGFLSGREEVIEDITRRKLAKTSSSTSKKETLEALKRQAYAKEYGKQLKKKLSSQAREQINPTKKPSFISKLGKQISEIESSIPKKQMQRQSKFNPQQKPKRFNPFEHRDNEEVYGDTGLTLFDSSKRNANNTGDFFGI